MPDPHLRHRNGVLLVAAAAVAWSTAPFFTRLLPLDAWTILFWRGLFGGSFILLFLVVTQGGSGIRSLIDMKKSGWLVAGLSTIGMVTFIPALQLTNVANVAIIIAAQPFAAGAVAWIWLQEQVPTRTMVASAVALAGISIIVSSAVDPADYTGIGLACLMMFAIATMTVAIRRYRETSMVAAAAMSNFVGCLVSVPFAEDMGAITGADIVVLAFFGFFQVGMGLTLFVLGSRLLPSAQASLVANLETPLMPFWVWLAFHETPGLRTIGGGALVIGAVIADIVKGDQQRGNLGAPRT